MQRQVIYSGLSPTFGRLQGSQVPSLLVDILIKLLSVGHSTTRPLPVSLTHTHRLCLPILILSVVNCVKVSSRLQSMGWVWVVHSGCSVHHPCAQSSPHRPPQLPYNTALRPYIHHSPRLSSPNCPTLIPQFSSLLFPSLYPTVSLPRTVRLLCPCLAGLRQPQRSSSRPVRQRRGLC